jgi:nicotinamidase-related amidase
MKKLIIFLIALFINGNLFIYPQGKETKEPDPVSPALIIIDIQKQFLSWIPEHDLKIAREYINGYIAVFRKKNLPIIRVYHTDPGWGPHPDSAGFQYPENIQIKPDDPMVIKNYASSFKKTNLHEILQQQKCNTLFLCGLSAIGCVISTYFAAKDLDYKTFMLKDAILSHNSTYTDNIEEIFGAIGYEVTTLILDQVKNKEK